MNTKEKTLLTMFEEVSNQLDSATLVFKEQYAKNLEMIEIAINRLKSGELDEDSTKLWMEVLARRLANIGIYQTRQH